jgi:NAD(P)-dependent dehydrogenase (short-subunit alcohol dehydrogenase family)
MPPHMADETAARNQVTRVALVSGANRGLGFEVARQLAAIGHMVILGSRDAASGEAAARTIGDRHPGRVIAARLDVTKPSDIEQLAARIDQRFGGLDVLINNAAVHYDTWQTAVAADIEGVVREAFETNVLGVWRLIRACVPLMLRKRWGRIVNVSSSAGAISSMTAGTPAYSTTKAALNALTRVVAAELRGSGILVNAVCPGWVATDMGGPGGRPVSEGAAGIVWAATLPDDGPSGGFFRDRRPIEW